MPRSSSTTDDGHAEVGDGIDRLSALAGRNATDVRKRIGRHLETLRREQESAPASAYRQLGAAREKLEQLQTDLDIWEHRLTGELAGDREEFDDAVKAELHDWDVYLDRLQARTSTQTRAARTATETAIADLRRRRDAVAASLSGVAATMGEAWRPQRERVDAALDELKRKADAARQD